MDDDVLWRALAADADAARRRLLARLAELLEQCEPGYEARLPPLDSETAARILRTYAAPALPAAGRGVEAEIRAMAELLREIDNSRRDFENKATRLGTELSPRVVLVSGTAAKARERFEPLRAAGFEVIERFDLAASDANALVEGLDGAWAVVADSANRFDGTTLTRLHALRVIARTGVGYDAIDVAAAAARRVVVFTTPGTLTETVADFAIALMLAALRDVVGLDAAVRSGAWRPRRTGRDLAGSTVAVVGFGAIGQAVARRLTGFACRVIAVDPIASDDVCARLGASRMALVDALPLADVVTLHVALTPSSRGLIGARELALLRPAAVLVNTSRGPVIDETALVEALRLGKLGAAALDVFEREPLPADHPLTRLDNVILSGHAASASIAAIERMCDATVAGLIAVARGEIPDGCLNREVVPRATEAGGGPS